MKASINIGDQRSKNYNKQRRLQNTFQTMQMKKAPKKSILEPWLAT